ncbi:hypothetical protein WT11_17615 [Burkholderia stagnalis]|nr:hypothetical protein WT11_17615 [Burkholderia stagnalis]
MTRNQEIAARPLAGTRQISVILPKFDFSLMSNELRMRKGSLSGCIHQSTYMVRVGVRKQDGVDRRGFDAGKQ